MKQKIYIRTANSEFFPKENPQGDWIDLYASEDMELNAPYVDETGKVVYDFRTIELNIGMMLPPGMEAHVAPRSSLFRKKGCILVNSPGIIDNSYNGDSDTWKFQALAFRKTFIKKNDLICQFRIIPSQKATFMQKLKWLLSGGIRLVPVSHLKKSSRGGIGSTGGM